MLGGGLGLGWMAARAPGFEGLDILATQDANKRASDAARDANALEHQKFYENIELQKEFAKNGLRWKIDDAASRGISPLAALGATGAAYSPVSFSTHTPSYESPIKDFASMGQNIMRAVQSTSTEEERDFQRMSQALQLENLQLQNEGIRLDNLAKQPSTPPTPVPSNSRFIVKPAETTATSRYDKSREAGPGIPSHRYTLLPSGDYVPVLSQDLKNSVEDSMSEKVMEGAMIEALVSGRLKPPDVKLLPGEMWERTAIGFRIGNRKSRAKTYIDRLDKIKSNREFDERRISVPMYP